jgi:hypothetical protein
MVKKPLKLTVQARSALAPMAHALLQGHLGPDDRIADPERFLTAVMQALHDAYALGWKDRGEIETTR